MTMTMKNTLLNTIYTIIRHVFKELFYLIILWFCIIVCNIVKGIHLPNSIELYISKTLDIENKSSGKQGKCYI